MQTIQILLPPMASLPWEPGLSVEGKFFHSLIGPSLSKAGKSNHRTNGSDVYGDARGPKADTKASPTSRNDLFS
jgi:hypothetical protein